MFVLVHAQCRPFKRRPQIAAADDDTQAVTSGDTHRYAAAGNNLLSKLLSHSAFIMCVTCAWDDVGDQYRRKCSLEGGGAISTG